MRLFMVLLFAALLAGKKKPEVTETLALPPEPPLFAVGDAADLVFHVSPLSGKGLLSQQTRDALKSILKSNGGAQVIHIRAFVAGSGDVRRVPQIVSEVFGQKKMALPSVSVVQVGALPLQNAQVVIEAVSEAKSKTNPGGVTFVTGEEAERAGTALAVTCFVSDLAQAQAVAAKFTGVFVDIVQTQRLPERVFTTCEAVVRGGKPGRLAFTGTHLSFQRLDRTLAEAGASPADIVSTNIYPLSAALGESARKDRVAPGTTTVVPLEGVASLTATFAVDAVALISK